MQVEETRREERRDEGEKGPRLQRLLARLGSGVRRQAGVFQCLCPDSGSGWPRRAGTGIGAGAFRCSGRWGLPAALFSSKERREGGREGGEEEGREARREGGKQGGEGTLKAARQRASVFAYLRHKNFSFSGSFRA